MNRAWIKKGIIIAVLLITAVSVDLSFIINSENIPGTTAVAAKNERRFALNFKDVEISEFLNVMSQLIQKNIIIDDKVKGKITISSAQKIPVSQAYDVMKSILEVKGLAVVETKNLIKVIPMSDAIRKNVEVIIDGERTEIEQRRDITVTHLMRLKNADVDEVANTLNPLKSKFTQIVVYRTLNTLIFSGNATEIEGLIKIAKSLDQRVSEGEPISAGYIHVVHLENANAEDLAGVLSRVPFSETAMINRSPATKSSVRKSSKSQRVTKSQAKSPVSTAKLSIIANKDTNSLIITAKPEEFNEIRRIIKQLDIVREQVLIEALIVEVSADNGWGFGIDWMLGKSWDSKHRFGGSSIQGSPPNYSTEGLPSYTNPQTGEEESRKLAVPLSGGLQIGYLHDVAQLGFALLNASATDSTFNVLSTPQILTIDNHEAELNVGEEIAVATNSRITDQNTTFQTFEYKNVGIKLKITPHITRKHRITLDLYQEVNSILGSETILPSGAVQPPKLGKRDIKTKVTIADGKTIVIGGLMKNNKSIEENKVPILGDIPVLGWLFKYKTVSYVKSNLLVFITPHILTKQERIDSITREKKKIINKMRKQIQE